MNILYKLLLFISIFICNYFVAYGANNCGDVQKSKVTYYLDSLNGNSKVAVGNVSYNGETVNVNIEGGTYTVERYISGFDFGIKVNGNKIIKLNFLDFPNNLNAFNNPINSDISYTNYQNKPNCPFGYFNYAINNNVFVCKKSQSKNYSVPCGSPGLTGEIYFYEENGGPININMGSALNTPLANGEYGEKWFNDFIDKGIEVSLHCTSSSCYSNTSSSILMTENGVGSLTIEDKYGRKLTKNYQVWKINKTKPTGNMTYTPDNNIWVNGSRTVTLNGSANGGDWLIGDSTPSYNCNNEGGCNGTLSLRDSAGNILNEPYSVKNIDKTKPIINIDLALVNEGDVTQKVTITCTDQGGSQCVFNNKILFLPLGISNNQCVYDIAGNSQCMSFDTVDSWVEYKDVLLPWTNNNRNIFLNCKDELGGSGCVQLKYSDIITNNINDTMLTISDRAGNTLTKHFQITKIDKIHPNVSITSSFLNDTFKASDSDKIKINANDLGSGINQIKYNWDNSCIAGANIIGTNVNNNEWINYTVAGSHKLYVCAIDNVGNFKEITKDFFIYPGDLNKDATLIVVDSNGDKFANNNDIYSYILTIRDKYNNNIYNKTLNILNYNVNSSHKVLYTSMINVPSGSHAIRFANNNKTSNSSGEIFFNIKSLSPGEFTQRFRLSLHKWGDDYINNSAVSMTYKFERDNNNNNFRQPIEGSISVIEGGDTPEMGKKQKYQVELNKVNNNNLVIGADFNGKLNISNLTITHLVAGHFWNTFGGIDNIFGNNLSDYLGFSGSIDANDNILDSIQLGLNNLPISYKLDGKQIEYYLNDFGTNGCNVSTLGLKVIGTLQGDGKSDVTGQETNFSDLSKGELRSKIRMSGYKLIKGLSNPFEGNGLKYVEGDIDISGNLDYETLIVKNGNIIISGDLNISNKKLGIIVLKDNYLIDSDYNNLGNIYVNKNVKTINAIIYADGAFRSADSNGYNYTDGELKDKLIFNGSLFTRNTIGGAVKANTEWVLPGGQETSDFDLAEIYDLNYIRKVDNSCNINEDYSFLIKYNSSIQTNPPKGFDIK